MSTHPSAGQGQGQGPGPGATVVPFGRDSARSAAPLAIGCLAVALIVLLSGVAAVALSTGSGRIGGIVAVVVGLLCGAFGASVLKSSRDLRDATISVDDTGLWVSNGKDQRLIAWDTLAGAGLYWSKAPAGRPQRFYSVELFPNGPIDRDDPVLWVTVRDEEPLHRALPRLRYRIVLTEASQGPVATAIQERAPHLWLGTSERPSAHIGIPDRKGHKERTRGN